MQLVTPSVHLIANTVINPVGLANMLNTLGVSKWETDADATDAEVLSEVAGKLCYMSFSTDLNKNLTKVGGRNNFDYIQEGIIGQKHGSVLEHSTVSLAMLNVSRVFTHELVRHRPGSAYSQTSGRYVRTDELSVWIPGVIKEDVDLTMLFEEAILSQEQILAKLVETSGIGRMSGPEAFAKKKKLTSAFRRIIGNGQANHILATYNHRALRHLIVVRTHASAEEEIRMVFGQVFDLVASLAPAIYADAVVEVVEGHRQISFINEKV